MHDRYMLIGHEPYKMHDLLVWGMWFEQADRRVAQTTVDDYWISTVFLGLDHSWIEGEVALFETMIFDKSHKNGEMVKRHATWDEAVASHNEAVKRCAHWNCRRHRHSRRNLL